MWSDRNAEKLPKSSGPLLYWVNAVDSTDLGQVISAYGHLIDFYWHAIQYQRDFDISLYAAGLRLHLENPLDLALGLICYESFRVSQHGMNVMRNACRELAGVLDRSG